MKPLLILIISFLSLSGYGQTNTLKRNSLSDTTSINKNDTVPLVEYSEHPQEKRFGTPIAFFLNGKFDTAEMSTFPFENKYIDSVSILKKEIEINGTKYYSQVHIQTTKEYKPKLISLNKLKEKYLNLPKENVLFQIGQTYIQEDYDKSFVDEKNIYKIIVQKIEQKSENIHLNIIRIETRSNQKNTKDKNTIMIR